MTDTLTRPTRVVAAIRTAQPSAEIELGKRPRWWVRAAYEIKWFFRFGKNIPGEEMRKYFGWPEPTAAELAEALRQVR